MTGRPFLRINGSTANQGMKMVNLRFRNKSESDYFYKMDIECFGKSIELSVSRTRLADLKKKGRSVLSAPKNLTNYLRKKREGHESKNKVSTSKKRAPKSEEQITQ